MKKEIVIVEWLDASTFDSVSSTQLDKIIGMVNCFTSGFLLRDNSKIVVVASAIIPTCEDRLEKSGYNMKGYILLRFIRKHLRWQKKEK